MEEQFVHSDIYIKEILEEVKTIALVGASSNPNKDSYIVMDALKNLGYEIFPVNPNYSGNMILGRKCYPNLKSIKEKIDIVVSGINMGANLGDDVIYSGTVAGAMEASLLGVPAIALSQRYGRDDPIDYAAGYLYGAKVIRHILDIGIPPRTVMNVNFPKTSPTEIKGVKAAYLDQHKLGDVIVSGDAPNHFRLGPLHSDPKTSPGSDREVLNDGWISLTPLMMDVTSHQLSLIHI